MQARALTASGLYGGRRFVQLASHRLFIIIISSVVAISTISVANTDWVHKICQGCYSPHMVYFI